MSNSTSSQAQSPSLSLSGSSGTETVGEMIGKLREICDHFAADNDFEAVAALTFAIGIIRALVNEE